MPHFDLVIVGAGTSGMPCAIEAVAAGAKVCVIEQSDRPGGTLHVSLGQMSGAGTRLQAHAGIADDAVAHLADIERINGGTARRDLLHQTVPRQGSTIDWLMDHGFDMDPSCPAILHLHEAYTTARTYWGVNGGLSVLKVVQPLFENAMAQPNASMRYNTHATALLTEGGRVTGLCLESEGAQEAITANAVVLATGGYGGNARMFERLTGRPLVTAALATSTGSGIEMGQAVGGRLVGADKYLPTYAGIPENADGEKVLWRHMPALTPQQRQPWELHLASDGRRFVREDTPSVDEREHALLALPDLQFWCVFSDAIQRAAPPLLPGWTKEELQVAWSNRPDFVTADDPQALALATGMDPTHLTSSLTAYAAACNGDALDPMGRNHCPMPIAGSGLRAIRMHGMVLKTPAGLDVTDRLEVRGDKGIIPGLYAVGEAMGGAALSGQGFVSGMSVTPALTLGRWLGTELGRSLSSHFERGQQL
ncbi:MULTISPECIES: FAD-dependent oxidoreductase [Marivita]|uniref:FAD-dependent oxidoreductase n=1 Tax=Marivita cryptomonadis TaxID=505252 RepID=A0A9Q2S1P0_9RHOB|nr:MULTISPECIES: FAD-dependent oxidoreductase [Marivita]MCR9168382.1 FAD-dependent oxidoreductase [Paracoccaceae bacterium]MBM2323717.1 FAD-dependent oxidoreductase [Marivita cryptomonadis]MBM2333305.1 FAD-dependent oxidoreductase [Marivita cryptomonadis]MBM2342883.1 FAD-dependent oxidoreductase [Marivita cryptomonadis]MBM2347553.1 FAD-dependent oxidoreductase [Marivita cryptomonadis]